MPSWLPRVLKRVRALAGACRVGFTEKALVEMAGLGLSREDVRQILAGLRPVDVPTRLRSSLGEEWMYEFRPRAGGFSLYLKVVLRQNVVVVSCHEDQAADGPDGAS